MLSRQTNAEQGPEMTSVTMRNLIDGLRRRLRARASRPGRPKEPAARGVSQASPDDVSLASTDLTRAIRARFAPLGGVEFELPTREPMRDPPHFE